MVVQPILLCLVWLPAQPALLPEALDCSTHQRRLILCVHDLSGSLLLCFRCLPPVVRIAASASALAAAASASLAFAGEPMGVFPMGS